MWSPVTLFDEHRSADEPHPLPVGADRRGAEAAGERYEVEQAVVALPRLGEQVGGEKSQRVALVGPVVGERGEVQP